MFGNCLVCFSVHLLTLPILSKKNTESYFIKVFLHKRKSYICHLCIDHWVLFLSRESDRISYRGQQAAIAQPGLGTEHTQQTAPTCQRKPT